MDALTISAASGLRARMESLDLLANNLANAATGGFKSDREFYGLCSSAAAEAGNSGLATVPGPGGNPIPQANQLGGNAQ